jgi:H+-transporting ATPase
MHTTKEFDAEERIGLTTEQADLALAEWGYNELPEVHVSLWWLFYLQFTGTMPYMLELAAVIAIAVQDYPDFAIILVMLICNGVLGFHEQLKAIESLAELTNKMEQKIAVLRDGKAEHMLTRCLVPGDVVLLLGGVQVPADIEWIEGDVLSVDTAALTGEPLPRKYPCEEHGTLILAACTIRAGEAYGVVRKTGIHTEIGSTNADIMQDKTEQKVSVFESRVLLAVKIIILVSLIDVMVIFMVQGIGRGEFTKSGYKQLLLTCLSIVIAAIPVALPIVLQVTMALGASKMATEFHCVVTSLPALQDISSMTVLCSDKTGTLTTARITIHAESVWCNGTFTKQDVALYGVLASSRDKKEDAIDRSVVGHFDRVFGDSGINITNEYTKVRNVGFNPIYKRVLYEYTHPKIGNITIAKGLPNKVLDTADGSLDDAADQWKCQDFEKLREIVKKTDYDFSKAGYKTLGIAVKINDGPFVFCGILPMLDPPRHDTAKTVENLVKAGIEVKMITGDHLNIAKETARLIGMGINIHRGEATRDATQERNELIRHANGFAQVLPKDKREVVLVLRNVFQQVIGMTGDGVNDAPALSAAQCGIAVDDATDAAKNAAAIILTSPGLSAIYMAVVESRRIFRKLKAYVTYRFAATIQIVCVLTLLIFISNCVVNPLFVILLALFNDLTMLPIAYDFQLAGSLPENPDVVRMLTVSFCFGVLETAFSMLFAYGSAPSGIFTQDWEIQDCDKQAQAAIWLQIFISAELLIFVARSPKYMPFYIAPSLPLFSSVIAGCILVSLMANLFSAFGNVRGADIVIIWCYNLIGLVFMDCLKMYLYAMFEENSDVLGDVIFDDKAHGSDTGDVEEGAEDQTKSESLVARKGEIHSERLSGWALSHSDRLSRMSEVERQSQASKPGRNQSLTKERASLSFSNMSGRISVVSNSCDGMGAYSELRPSLVSGNIRPRTPGQMKKC